MAQFHFVEDYEKLIKQLVSDHPLDEAMAIAVGGSYEGVGLVEVEILRRAGLHNGSHLLDLGCGSGRLACMLGKSDLTVTYTGVDIVQQLLDYAVTRAPRSYRFLLHRSLDIPAPDNTLDVISAFSVFTHLLHHETYLYMQDTHRALHTGGKLVFSFLEFREPEHWNNFIVSANSARVDKLPHLNSYLERDVISMWAEKLNYIVENYINATENVAGVGCLGQTTAILQKL